RRLARLEPPDRRLERADAEQQRGPVRPPGAGVVVAQRLLDRGRHGVADEVDLHALRRPALEGEAEADRQQRREPVDPEDTDGLAVELPEPGQVQFAERVRAGHGSWPWGSTVGSGPHETGASAPAPAPLWLRAAAVGLRLVVAEVAAGQR